MPSATGSRPDHYERLGLTPGVIAPWEDALRTDPAATTFEWWYFDCVDDDGVKLAIEFHTKPPYASPKQSLSPYVSFVRGDVVRAQELPAEAFSAARDCCDVRIGPNTFRGDLDTYEIHVELEDVVADIRLEREVPSWRPETGHCFVGEQEEHFVAWLPAVPRGRVSGTLRIGDDELALRGAGYHDHNWGNAPLRRMIDHWYWGRALLGDYSVITLNFIAHADHGAGRHPALMIARGDQVLASAVEDIAFDAREDGVTYRFAQGHEDFTVTFARERQVFALDFGAAGSYRRFMGDATLEHRVRKPALWELLDFSRGPVPA